jgi:hypothetical protein
VSFAPGVAGCDIHRPLRSAEDLWSDLGFERPFSGASSRMRIGAERPISDIHRVELIGAKQLRALPYALPRSRPPRCRHRSPSDRVHRLSATHATTSAPRSISELRRSDHLHLIGAGAPPNARSGPQERAALAGSAYRERSPELVRHGGVEPCNRFLPNHGLARIIATEALRLAAVRTRSSRRTFWSPGASGFLQPQ